MVFIKTPDSKTLALNLNPCATTLRSLSTQIESRIGLPATLHRIYLSPRLISSPQNDGVLLTALGIFPNSTLTLHVPLLGGMQPAPATKARLDFLNTKPPANYVSGLGRGATGFTTRSDIGPARAAPDLPDRAIGAPGGAPATGVGHGRGKGEDEEEEEEVVEKGYDEHQKFDDFEGNDTGLLAPTAAEYDEEDRIADEIWENVENIMDQRRKDKREAKLKEEIEKYRASNPKITEQFAGLKRKLVEVTAEEWENIPDIGDYTLRNKKKRFESFVPVPDTLLEKARQEKEHVSALDPRSRAVGGTETPWSQTPVTDLTAVGEGRGTVLSLKLDRLSDSVTGQTVVDPKGYLTDLKSMKITSDADIADIKKARLLLSSVINSNPKHAPGWIAAARLEEVAGKISAARHLITKGCDNCPRSSEDIWLEAVRLSPPTEAKAVIAKAVKLNPSSVKLWMEAARLEHDKDNKSKVLRKALLQIPGSVRLWKAAVELANDDDEARILLKRAVECCPLHVELWLALARLEDYENAKKVLNDARRKLPKEPLIWITAAKLEEFKGNHGNTLIEKAIRALQKEGVEIDREMWMKEAEAAERSGSVKTCKDIIKNTIGIGVEEEDRKRTWVADAEECKKRGSIETARAIYEHATSHFNTKKSVWLKAAQLEKSHGTRESLDELLRRAVKYVPTAEVLWLMGAKEKWLAGDVQAARDILREAYASIPLSEEIWLAAFKLEFENQEPERARLLLAKAREKGGTERVWMKSAIVERELGNTEKERELLEAGIKLYPSFFKLWLMLGQLEERLGRLAKARRAYESGVEHCPTSIPLWLSFAKLEEENESKARAILESARKKNPQNPEAWRAAIRFESRHGHKKVADSLLARALQVCPTSGILRATEIEMAPRAERKKRCSDAIMKCEHEQDRCYVSLAVAKLFWQERKVEKARKYLNEAVTYAPDIGDFWAYMYKFELQNGTEETQKDVVRRCVAVEPKHGEIWQATSKAVENSHQPTEAILKKVVVALGKHDIQAPAN